MEQVAGKANALLTLAASLGNVMILTLGKRPCVTIGSKWYSPSMEKTIERLGITVMYAQEFSTGAEEPNVLNGEKINDAWLEHWSSKKARAMSCHLEQFYSKYDGQSWKNVISIGDSDFERDGMEAATSGYLEKAVEGSMVERPRSQSSLTAVQGSDGGGDGSPCKYRICEEIDTGGKILKLRAKTIKMVEGPTPEQLCEQIDVLSEIMTALVRYDGGIDINLEHLKGSHTQTLLADLG